MTFRSVQFYAWAAGFVCIATSIPVGVFGTRLGGLFLAVMGVGFLISAARIR